MNFALQNALANLQLLIEESHAAVVHDQLPIVRGGSDQLSQLFQNRVSNAIKYRSVAPPKFL